MKKELQSGDLRSIYQDVKKLYNFTPQVNSSRTDGSCVVGCKYLWGSLGQVLGAALCAWVAAWKTFAPHKWWIFRRFHVTFVRTPTEFKLSTQYFGHLWPLLTYRIAGFFLRIPCPVSIDVKHYGRLKKPLFTKGWRRLVGRVGLGTLSYWIEHIEVKGSLIARHHLYFFTCDHFAYYISLQSVDLVLVVLGDNPNTRCHRSST